MQADARARLQRALAALAAGDREAFDDVFPLAWPVLRAIAVRMLGEDEAEDAAQRALLKLFSHASRYEPERDALPWIVTFVLNEVRTVHNRRRRKARARPHSQPPVSDPEALLLDAELRAALREVVGTLNARDQHALGLTAGEERSPNPRERAVAPATVRKRRQRAIGKLKTAWRRIHGLA